MRGLLLVAATPILFLTTAHPAAAQAPAEPNDDALVVEQVLSDQYDAGDLLALRITVSADRLIDGRVEVRSEGSALKVQQRAQVAGGSTEAFYLLVPTSAGGPPPQLVVELFHGAESLDSDKVAFVHDVGVDVAGVLPVLQTRSGVPPDRVTLPGDLRRVRLVSLPAELMSNGAAAITQLDSIAATSADLAALDPPGRAALLTWIDHGGHLVLDDADDLEALPSRWRPGVAGYAFAGQGEVRVAGGELTAGKWKEALRPTSLSFEDDPMGGPGVDMVIDPRITLAQRAGVRLPDLSLIIAVLGGYVLLVGPVLYLVLRRLRRLTSAWLIIPVTAGLLAGGVVITGSTWRNNGRPTSSTVLEVHPGGSYAYRDMLVFRSSGGTTSVPIPDDWVISGQSADMWFGSSGSAARVAIVEDGHHRIDTRLEAGQIAVLGAEGASASEPIQIEARMTGANRVAGTVTNSSSVQLHSVAVFVGGQATLVGDINAGQSADFEIKDLPEVSDPFASGLGTVWSDPRFGLGFNEPTAGVDLGIWTSYASRRGFGLYPTGFARVAGWTDEMAAAGSDNQPFLNSTLVTALVPIAPSDGPLTAMSIRSTVVQTAFDPRTGQQREPIIRFVVPPDRVGDPFEMQLPDGISAVSVLTADGEWSKLDAPGSNKSTRALPPALLAHGSVVVRSTLDFTKQIDFTRTQPTLREVAP